MHMHSAGILPVVVLAALLQSSSGISGKEACSEDDETCSVQSLSLMQTALKMPKTPVATLSQESRKETASRSRTTKRRRRQSWIKAPESLAHIGNHLHLHSTLTSEHGSREDAQAHAAFYLSNFVLIIVVVCIIAYLLQDRTEDADADVEVRNNLSFEEDAYSSAIALVARDWYILSKPSTLVRSLPAFRMIWAALLCSTTLVLQLLLLYCTKAYVTPQQVAGIRDSYDAYEIHMYGGEDNTRVLSTGKHRGLPGHFNASLFETLDDDVKGDVCQIPLSQLKFLVFVLLVWSITCVCKLNSCVQYTWNLTFCLPTIPSMQMSIITDKAGQPRRKWTIVGLTFTAKVILMVCLFLPWLLSTCYLCWLGSRWLTATNDFGDLVSNAMALEFILNLPELMYFAVSSERMKRDLSNTRYKPPCQREGSGTGVYFSSLMWGLFCIAWVYMYIFHLQRVLPDYQWDVHSTCSPMLAGKLRPSPPDQ